MFEHDCRKELQGWETLVTFQANQKLSEVTVTEHDKQLTVVSPALDTIADFRKAVEALIPFMKDKLGLAVYNSHLQAIGIKHDYFCFILDRVFNKEYFPDLWSVTVEDIPIPNYLPNFEFEDAVAMLHNWQEKFGYSEEQKAKMGIGAFHGLTEEQMQACYSPEFTPEQMEFAVEILLLGYTTEQLQQFYKPEYFVEELTQKLIELEKEIPLKKQETAELNAF